MESDGNGIIPLFEEILHKAFELQASDIHLEPREEYLRVRYRVDGLLSDGTPVNKGKQAALISRVKVLVSLDIAESRLPQDGRTDVKIGKQAIDLRVSTIPTIHGEKVVIRLLNRRDAQLKLEELGMEKGDLELYRQLIAKRCGRQYSLSLR